MVASETTPAGIVPHLGAALGALLDRVEVAGLVNARHERPAIGAVLDRRKGRVIDTKAPPLTERNIEMAAEDDMEGEAMGHDDDHIALLVLRSDLLDRAPRPFLDL